MNISQNVYDLVFYDVIVVFMVDRYIFTTNNLIF